VIPWLHLVVAALIWIGTYNGLRAPRQASGEYRESPSFDAKSRPVAIAWATLLAGLFIAYGLHATRSG
jgi:hypothetical protein